MSKKNKNKNTFKNICQHVFGTEEKTSNDLVISTDPNSAAAQQIYTAQGNTATTITINPQGTAAHTITGPNNLGGGFNSGTWRLGPSNNHVINGSFLTPKSKEEAVKEILAQLELGSITRDDLVKTIEYEKMVACWNKINKVVNGFQNLSGQNTLLERAEAALVEHDIQKMLESE